MGFCEKCDLLFGKLNKTFGYDSNLVSLKMERRLRQFDALGECFA